MLVTRGGFVAVTVNRAYNFMPVLTMFELQQKLALKHLLSRFPEQITEIRLCSLSFLNLIFMI
jgi:hypothetical protein